MVICFFFFFQAEDGIRDGRVTGVQTCALPILRRQLDDDVGIRIAASREGCSYLEWRMKLMEFLDATPEGLTPDDGAEFVRPRIAGWDIDYDTHAMRIVLRSQDPAPRQVRALSI